MLVGVELEPLWLGNHDSQKLGHFLLDRLGIWFAKKTLEPFPAPSLSLGHGALAAQLALGEAVEVVRPLAGQDVVARGMVLAVLEALEAIEGHGLRDRSLRPQLLVEELAVAAQARRHPGDGLRRDPLPPRRLAVADATHQQVEDGLQEVRELLPVGDEEGLAAEVSSAPTALVPLDDSRGSLASKEAVLDEPP